MFRKHCLPRHRLKSGVSVWFNYCCKSQTTLKYVLKSNQKCTEIPWRWESITAKSMKEKVFLILWPRWNALKGKGVKMPCPWHIVRSCFITSSLVFMHRIMDFFKCCSKTYDTNMHDTLALSQNMKQLEICLLSKTGFWCISTHI